MPTPKRPAPLTEEDLLQLQMLARSMGCGRCYEALNKALARLADLERRSPKGKDFVQTVKVTG